LGLGIYGLSAVTILHEDLNSQAIESGAYVLRVSVAAPLSLSFGRFQKGRQITVPAGDALYIGSAMGRRGSSTLALRLLRHATRTTPLPPHRIRAALLAQLQGAGMGGEHLQPPATKTCHWHVDYLLDRPEVELTHILAIRSITPLETTIARRLNADASTAVIAPGLGASDSPAIAHLLHLRATPGWWAGMIDDLSGAVWRK